MVALTQKIGSASSLIQGALPAILQNTPASLLEHVNSVLAENAHIAFDTLSRVPGLKARFVRIFGRLLAPIVFSCSL
jgi:succinyl-CoA synthetase beta subunit